MFLLRLGLHGGNVGNPEQSGGQHNGGRVEENRSSKEGERGCHCGFVTEPGLFAWVQQDKMLRCGGLQQREGLFPRQPSVETGETVSDAPGRQGAGVFIG